MKLSKLLQSFVPNKYLLAYEAIIENVRVEQRSKSNGYYELHHIIPKSIAPEISNLRKHPWNGVLLTPKEHFIAHRLLCKFTVGEERNKALRAYNAVCFHTRRATGYAPTSLQYSKAREAMSIAGRALIREQKVPKWSGCSTMDDFTALIKELVLNGISDPEIGQRYGISSNAVNAWRKKLGIAGRRPFLRNKEWLLNEYENNNRSADDIAEELGCTGSAVRQYLYRYGAVTKVGNTKYNRTKLEDATWLAEQYTSKSIQDIANIIGCSRPTVATYLDKYNIKRKS